MFCATCGHRYDDHPFRHIFKGQVPPGEFVHGSKSRVTAENAKDAEIARLRAELAAAQSSIDRHLEQTEFRRKEADMLIKELDAAHSALGIGPSDTVTIAAAVESLKRDLAAARAALATEREACDSGVSALSTILDAWSTHWMPNLRAAVRAFVTEQLNRRAAEANERQAMDAYYSDPESRVRVPADGTAYFQRIAAEAKGAKDNP